MGKRNKGTLSSEQLSILFDNLALLTKSGLPAWQSVILMQESADNDEFGQVLQQLQAALRENPYLHEAMASTGLFPEYAVRMVQIGENSGKLETVLESLGNYYNRENQLKAQMKSAVLNPFVLICIMCVVIVFLMVQVIPIFGNVYEQFGISMTDNPMVSAALTVGQVSMWIIIALLAIVVVGFLLSLSTGGQRVLTRFFSKFPLTRKSAYLLDVTRFTSALSLQISSGVDTVTAYRLAMEATATDTLRQKLEQGYPEVEDGAAVGEILCEMKIYNSSCTSMLLSGSRAGSTENVLQRIADMYEEESQSAMDNILSLIEPILIGFLSVVIGIILICIMFPLVGLMSSIG